MATAPLIAVDALGPAGDYHARERQPVTDVAGNGVAELSLVPTLFISRTMSALRRAGALPVDDRLAAIARACAAFGNATVDGLSVAEYARLVSRVAGLPITLVRRAAEGIARQARGVRRDVECARPRGAVYDWRNPLTHAGRAVWARRGDVFAVHAPANNPGVHSLWLEALALGYRVAVRPSQREPFSARRLVSALRMAGFGEDRVALLPTDHSGADEILRQADLAMAYGGDEVVRKYAAQTNVLPQGPGRSKILITSDVDWREHMDVIVESIAADAGTGCINTTAVFVEGDPTPLALAIADRLAPLPSLPPEDDRAVLPVQPLASARRLEHHLLDKAAGTTAWLGADGIVDEIGDGSAVLRPAVHQLDRPDAPQARIELAFPCVWIAPWSREAGVQPLKDTLVLTALSHDERLIDALLAEPTISNVYIGDHPTTWMEPGIPHDGYLADFLMRCKGVIHD